MAFSLSNFLRFFTAVTLPLRFSSDVRFGGLQTAEQYTLRMPVLLNSVPQLLHGLYLDAERNPLITFVNL